MRDSRHRFWIVSDLLEGLSIVDAVYGRNKLTPKPAGRRRGKTVWVSRRPVRKPIVVKRESDGEMVQLDIKGVPQFEIIWPKGKTLDIGKNQQKRQRRKYAASLKGPAKTPRGTGRRVGLREAA